LPISSFFTSYKIHWLLENVAEVREAVAQQRCLVGTIDTWLIWNLTGGPAGTPLDPQLPVFRPNPPIVMLEPCLTGASPLLYLGKNFCFGKEMRSRDASAGGAFVTDVSNASATNMMELATREWHQDTLDVFGIERDCLAQIKSNAELYGRVSQGPLQGVPISGETTLPTSQPTVSTGNHALALLTPCCACSGQRWWMASGIAPGKIEEECSTTFSVSFQYGDTPLLGFLFLDNLISLTWLK
jgi:hypothetical protein